MAIIVRIFHWIVLLDSFPYNVIMKQVNSPVVSRQELMSGIHLLTIDAPAIAAASYPGQFVTIQCENDTLLRRPFSIHKSRNGHLELLFAIVGQGTQSLATCKEGELLDVLGPLGNGFVIHEKAKNILLIAGGIGIAPLVYLAEKAIMDGFSVKLALGAATSFEINCLESLVPSGIEIIKVTNDGSVGVKGMVTDVVPSLIEWADQVFACGPIPMYLAMSAMRSSFEDKSVGVQLEQVMGCGTGACRGCALPTKDGVKMVCTDGPLFDLNMITWDQVTATPKMSRSQNWINND